MCHRLFLLASLALLAACVESPNGPSQAGMPPLAAPLAQGRHLFLTRCARCHGLPDPAQCSERVMDDMAPQAGLKPQERRLVDAYLASVRK